MSIPVLIATKLYPGGYHPSFIERNVFPFMIILLILVSIWPMTGRTLSWSYRINRKKSPNFIRCFIFGILTSAISLATVFFLFFSRSWNPQENLERYFDSQIMQLIIQFAFLFIEQIFLCSVILFLISKEEWKLKLRISALTGLFNFVLLMILPFIMLFGALVIAAP